MKTWSTIPVCVALLILIAGAGAEAKEESEAAALAKQLGALRKARNATELADTVGEVPPVCRRTGNPAEHAKLRKELGKIAKQRDLGVARPAAVRALAQLEDRKLAWQEMSSLLPGQRVEEASTLDLAVIRAAGKLAQGKTAKPLLGLVSKAKDPKLAVAAAEALGGFQTAPKTRLIVLKELVGIGVRSANAASGSGAAATAAAERWKLVGPGVVRGLNRLTGQDFDSVEAWVAAYERHSREPKKLFLPGAG